MGDKLRVAAVGTGFFSQFHFDAWSRIDDVDLAAICSLDPGSRDEVAARYAVADTFDDFERMLDDIEPDLVDIITPPPTHCDFIKAAQSRNIPVICQKPFTGTLEGAQMMADLADETGTPVIVHENFRFQPWFGEIRRVIDSGKLGELYQARFCLRPGDGQGPRAYLDRQPYFQAMERFLVHETAIHLIDVFRYLFGEADHVLARLKRLNPAIAGEDSGVIILEHRNNVQGLIDCNRLVDHAANNHRLTMGEMWVEAEKGVLRLNGYGQLFLRPHGANDETEIKYDWLDHGYAGDCVYRLQSSVVRHFTEGETLPNTARNYITNLRIEEAVYQSNSENRLVDLT